jgi:hypothetical protein
VDREVDGLLPNGRDGEKSSDHDRREEESHASMLNAKCQMRKTFRVQHSAFSIQHWH